MPEIDETFPLGKLLPCKCPSCDRPAELVLERRDDRNDYLLRVYSHNFQFNRILSDYDLWQSPSFGMPTALRAAIHYGLVEIHAMYEKQRKLALETSHKLIGGASPGLPGDYAPVQWNGAGAPTNTTNVNAMQEAVEARARILAEKLFAERAAKPRAIAVKPTTRKLLT